MHEVRIRHTEELFITHGMPEPGLRDVEALHALHRKAYWRKQNEEHNLVLPDLWCGSERILARLQPCRPMDLTGRMTWPPFWASGTELIT